MRKTIVIILISAILSSCFKQREVDHINNYITVIDNQDNFYEIERHYSSDHLQDEAVGGDFEIRTLRDSIDNIVRIKAHVTRYNETFYDYHFYYKHNELIYSKILKYIPDKFNTKTIDTIMNSNYYWNDEKLIHQVNLDVEWVDVQTISDIEEFYYEIAKE